MKGGDVPYLGGLKMSEPICGPYVVTSRFGDYRSYPEAWNVLPFHEGIDLAPTEWEVLYAPAATPIYPGQVVTAKWSEYGYGNYVRLRHVWAGITVYSWYCHLDAWTCDVGAYVRPGDCIGFIGDTGNASGPHLHLTINLAVGGPQNLSVRGAINPANYIDFTGRGFPECVCG